METKKSQNPKYQLMKKVSDAIKNTQLLLND
jgi:hypothetical protein